MIVAELEASGWVSELKHINFSDVFGSFSIYRILIKSKKVKRKYVLFRSDKQEVEMYTS